MTTADALNHLQALASGLCVDAGIRLEAGDDNWAYDPVRRVIRVERWDLARRGADYCAGLIAHEVGHFFVSRYHRLRVDFPSRVVLGHVLNALEDPRSDHWMVLRYPGVAAWLGAVRDGLELPGSVHGLPAILQFCLGCVLEPERAWTRPDGFLVSGDALDALDRTRDARQRYIRTVPTAATAAAAPARDPGDDRFQTRVVPRLQGHFDPAWATPREQEVLLSALDALEIAEAHVLPAASRLAALDTARIAQVLLERAERGTPVDPEDGAQVNQVVREAASRPPPCAPCPSSLRRQATKVLDAFLAGTNAAPRPVLIPVSATVPPGGPVAPAKVLSHGPGDGLPVRPVTLPPLGSPIRFPPPADEYGKALARVMPQVTRLSARIEDLLKPSRRMGDHAGYPSGHQVDIRRLFAFESDPRRWAEIWRRKSIPDRQRTAFCLLVDLSGSMRNDRIEAALAGAVLLVETLARVDVPFAVRGFQDRVIPFVDYGEPLTPGVRARLGEMPLETDSRRPGGNNRHRYNDDGPCLLEAGRELLAQPVDTRILIAISDGEPAGHHSGSQELHDAVAELRRDGAGLRLIGLGVGPGTEHVSTYYPESIADVPVEELATRIADVLGRVLVG